MTSPNSEEVVSYLKKRKLLTVNKPTDITPESYTRPSLFFTIQGLKSSANAKIHGEHSG